MDILLGCGHSRKRMISPVRKDWSNLVTVDINQECKPDVEWDLNKIPLPFSDNYADEIHAYSVLEHCGTQGDYRFFFAQFDDFWRILKPGGFFCATVPMPNTIWTWGDPGHTREINNGTICFLDRNGYSQCGETARTDYRFCYKGNFKILSSIVDNETYYFVLQAIKGKKMAGASTIDSNPITIGGGVDDGIILAKSDGKIGFFDTTPVAIQTGGSAAPTTTVTTVTTATVTTGSTSTSPYGYATTTQADLVTSDIAALIASLNIIKNRLDALTTSYNSTLTAIKAYGVIV